MFLLTFLLPWLAQVLCATSVGYHDLIAVWLSRLSDLMGVLEGIFDGALPQALALGVAGRLIQGHEAKPLWQPINEAV